MENSVVKITFPDGSQKEYPKGITPGEIAKGISHKLAKLALAAKFNGNVVELWRSLEEDGELQILTFEDKEGKEVFWHSSAHLMAQAIKRKYGKHQVKRRQTQTWLHANGCLLYTSPSPRDTLLSRMPSSA